MATKHRHQAAKTNEAITLAGRSDSKRRTTAPVIDRQKDALIAVAKRVEALEQQ